MIVDFQGDPPPLGTAAKFRTILSVVECESWTDEYHVFLEQAFAGDGASFKRTLCFGDGRMDADEITDMAVIRAEAAECGVDIDLRGEEGLHDLARAYARRKSCRMVHQTDHAGKPMMILAQATTSHSHRRYSWPKDATKPASESRGQGKGGRACS